MLQELSTRFEAHTKSMDFRIANDVGPLSLVFIGPLCSTSSEVNVRLNVFNALSITVAPTLLILLLHRVSRSNVVFLSKAPASAFVVDEIGVQGCS
jgi:hypothetical protein